MMKPQDVDNLRVALATFREIKDRYERSNCISSFVVYYSGRASTDLKNDALAFAAAKDAIVAHYGAALRESRDALSASGVDVTDEMPEELR